MDKVFYNGKIYSMDSNDNVYSAIGISGDRISFLGNAGDGSLPEAGQYIDLKGMTVLPGFTDSHLHMLNYGFLEKSYKMYDAFSPDYPMSG